MSLPRIQNGTTSCLKKLKDWINATTLEVFRSSSQRFLDSKKEGFGKPDIFENEDMAEHFAHERLVEIAFQNVVQGFIISRIVFIENSLGNKQIFNDSFMDIGDSDGIFIKSLGKHEISANMSEMAVNNIYKKGIVAIRCDSERLPFKNGSVDHILFFQIFEHLPNPISALRELNRVAKKSIFISIPYVSKTNLHKYNYNPMFEIFEHHIFEFNDEDFRKIITHANLYIRHHEIVTVLPAVSLKERCVFSFWNLIGVVLKNPEYKNVHSDLFNDCFKKFSIYHLTKKN